MLNNCIFSIKNTSLLFILIIAITHNVNNMRSDAIDSKYHIIPNDWRSTYEEKHRITSEYFRNNGKFPDNQKVIIFVIREGPLYGVVSGGMSDRTTGLMTIATFAIARNIPIFIDWPEGRELFDSTMDMFIFCKLKKPQET